MKKRSTILLIAVILGLAYSIYITTYFSGVAMVDLGGALAAALVTPHMVFMWIGSIFGGIGYMIKASWAALVGAIIWTVASVMFVPYMLMVAPIFILGYIGYSKQKSLNAVNAS